MKKKAKIIGVKVGVDGNLDDYFDGFQLFGVGYVDIEYDYFPELEDMSQDEVLGWAYKQHGKHLFYEGLAVRSYTATGKMYLV